MFCRLFSKFRVAAHLKRTNLKSFLKPSNLSKSLENKKPAFSVRLKEKEQLFRHPFTLPEKQSLRKYYISGNDIWEEKSCKKTHLKIQFLITQQLELSGSLPRVDRKAGIGGRGRSEPQMGVFTATGLLHSPNKWLQTPPYPLACPAHILPRILIAMTHPTRCTLPKALLR